MGKDFILVRLSREAPAEEIANLSRSWEALPLGIVQHYGTTARHYRFFLMRGFCGRTHQLLSVD